MVAFKSIHLNSNDFDKIQAMSTTVPTEPHHVLGMRLVGLARRWRQALDHRLSEDGLSDAAWAPLMHLHRLGDGVSQSELAAAVGLDGSSLVRLLDLLAEQGLIERQAHPSDRRIKRVCLTPEGSRTVASIRQRLRLVEDELMADLDPDTVRTVLQAFDHIEARIAAQP
jgi:MarR family transcriptional regulator for hemolysin